MIDWLIWLTCALSLVPVSMAVLNLPLFRRLPRRVDDECGGSQAEPAPVVSVLIPARNEADRLGPTLAAVRASQGVRLELLVLDDGSTDATASIVQQHVVVDDRVRVIEGGPLPAGWSGKQHACDRLAREASHDVLIWLDADVRLAPDALHRAARALHRGKADLISGFPYQQTDSLAEKLVVPLLHLLLLGYLPMLGMRLLPHPSFAAGCGQFFVARRQAYEDIGGHAAIAHSFHDGITLPRAFRAAGRFTDVFDATDLATCRMYEGLGDLWWGFVKNAHEGMATPIALPIWSLLLVGGHVLPWVLLPVSFVMAPSLIGVATISCGLAGGFSVVIGWRYQHPGAAIVARPVGVLLLLAIQWHALLRRMRGRVTPWRGRVQPTSPEPSTVSAGSGETT